MGTRTRRNLIVGATSLMAAIAGCVPTPIGPRAPVIEQFAAAATDLSAPALVPLAWQVRDPNRDALTCRIDATSDGVWDETMSSCQLAAGRNFPAEAGSYVATFEVADSSHPPVIATAPYSVGVGPSESFDFVTQQVTAPDPRVAAALDDAVSRWSAVILRGVSDEVVHLAPAACTGETPGFDGVVDDLVIQVAVIPDVGGFMADAAPCAHGPDGLPRLSIIRLDADWVDWMDDNGHLGDLLVHEMGHALGFTGANWWPYRQELSPGDFRFVGPRAVAEWSALGGTGSVPLSNGGDHWDETILRNEVMTCTVEALTSHPLSSLTVAAMADIGYHVDPGAAEPWSLPPEPAPFMC